MEVLFQLASSNERNAQYNAFYKLDVPRQQLEHFVQNVVRSSIPRMTLDEVFLDLVSLKAEVQERLEAVMIGFGYELLGCLIVDISPHARVVASMNEIQVQLE